jgi:septum formation protein
MAIDDSGIRRLILASGSPRRRQLLPLLGLPFVIKRVSVDEQSREGEPPSELVVRVSQAKALAVNGALPGDLVLAADTVVALNGQALGKPVDAASAIDMLRRLRGRPHIVYSGVSVWFPARRRMVTELAASTVWMRDYDDQEIERYVESGDPQDKAGAYAIQHPQFDPVARVEGCALSVMGLPLCHLGRALAQFGVVVPSSAPGACRAFSQQDCHVWPQILPDGGQAT